MSLRLRVLLVFGLIAAAGFYYLARGELGALRGHYLEAMEESMVDTAQVLAALVGATLVGEADARPRLRRAFSEINRQELSAQIYRLHKSAVELRVYVTDRHGKVVFDSAGGRDEGADYSRWNDVYLTLRGRYGARSTHERSGPADTSVLYVAAPIVVDGQIAGVLSVGKPAESVAELIAVARDRLITVASLAAAVVIALVTVLTLWVTGPLRRLTVYAQAVRDGKPARLPPLGPQEVRVLGQALEEMRRALEGKRYVEHYVQTLTHEIKAPVSAIQGAAELLDEHMPAQARQRFLANIRGEADRLGRLVGRLLELASLEGREALRDVKDIALAPLVAEVLQALEPIAEARRLTLAGACPEPLRTRGEEFLVRQALANLVQNALDFSPEHGTVELTVGAEEGGIQCRVRDQGPGVPEYALERVFERFYSLERPSSGLKSSGLGLSLVREVARLHGGRAGLRNRPEGGAEATLSLPAAAAGR